MTGRLCMLVAALNKRCCSSASINKLLFFLQRGYSDDAKLDFMFVLEGSILFRFLAIEWYLNQ